jgi:hypothetical protein
VLVETKSRSPIYKKDKTENYKGKSHATNFAFVKQEDGSQALCSKHI